MEQLLSSLGPNKIHLPIHRNELCETKVFPAAQTSLPSGFECFDDLLPRFQSISHGVAAAEKSFHRDKPREKCASDPLLEALACQLDPTLSLFSGPALQSKVHAFRQSLVDNLDNHHQAYKKIPFRMFKLSLDDVRSSLSNTERTQAQLLPVLLYMSHLLQSNVIMDPHVVQYDTDRYIRITQTPFGHFEFDRYESGFRALAQERAAQNAQGLDEKKLNTMLVAELRDTATRFGIATCKKDESGKKKPLLKAELISELARYLATLHT